MQSRSDEWIELCAWARTAGLDLSGLQLDQLRAYVDTLRFWNTKISLVSQRDSDRLIRRHVADSLFAGAQCADGEAVIDVGSGAGFPGLPIAIIRPASRVCLVESRRKKASFLSEAVRLSGAGNVTVVHARFEPGAAAAPHARQYDVAIARALGPLAEFCAAARVYLRPNGRAIAMQSTAQAAATKPGERLVPYCLPDGSERRLLIIPASSLRSG